MSAMIKSITVTGHNCSNLTSYAEREKVLEMVCGDRSLGRWVDTPVGKVDRAQNPTVVVETEWVPEPV